jgi:hypothetical protein
MALMVPSPGSSAGHNSSLVSGFLGLIVIAVGYSSRSPTCAISFGPAAASLPNRGLADPGRQVLRFRHTGWERQVQRLEITSGELLPGEPVPLLKNRREISRAEALKLREEKRKAPLCQVLKGYVSSFPPP